MEKRTWDGVLWKIREREVISGSYRKVALESYILSKVKFTTNLNIKFYKICKIYM